MLAIEEVEVEHRARRGGKRVLPWTDDANCGDCGGGENYGVRGVAR